MKERKQFSDEQRNALLSFGFSVKQTVAKRGTIKVHLCRDGTSHAIYVANGYKKSTYYPLTISGATLHRVIEAFVATQQEV